jgi:hypothetical protein
MSYDEFDGLVGVLCRKLQEMDLRDPVICGIERGGLVPAVVMSHTLGWPFRSIRVGDPMPPEGDAVAVDDMLDTGRTYSMTHGYAAYAALMTRRVVPGLVYGRLYDGGWVTFPWEAGAGSPANSPAVILPVRGSAPSIPRPLPDT